MAFCGNCGNLVEDGAAFCGNCGSPIIQAAPQQQYQQAPQQQYQQAPQQQYQQAPQQQFQQQYQQATQQQYQQASQQTVIPTPVQVTDNDVAASKGVAWLSYIGLLWLIPFFVKKNYKYARFHVRQGATLFACELAYSIAYNTILLPIDLATREVFYDVVIHSGFYNALNTIFGLAWVFFTIVAIIGIVRAASGKKIELPLIGKIPFVKMLIDKWYTGMGIDVSNDD